MAPPVLETCVWRIGDFCGKSVIRHTQVRFGERRARFMMSNWCLTASDSAATAPRPPGLASFARVTSKWAIKMNRFGMKANFNRK